ncbi:hypothetical protein [Duganella callida]|uniref:DUF3828 domain-containing protein n=1 Tax=Duganella callida TaxID=2561932 RepID=A0A4Y9S6M5_9BURK|nr:hypothetical protein [Duganella callida]TFW16862.1 hypothetical protein E4L98_22270 [Duganella callida]
MKIDKKHLLPLCVGLFIFGLVMVMATRAWSERQRQLDFITDFYRDHLSRPEARSASQLPGGSFFSKELEALVDANSQLCDSLSRGDDVCGYGADGDVFMQAQEVAPSLDFERAGFKAARVGDNLIEASFNVHPDLGDAYARKVRYALVREDSGWRVDDMLFDGGSMRQELQRENNKILARARELADAAGWVYNYLGHEDMLDRAVRFIDFPVQVCDAYDACAALKRDDPRLMPALDALGDAAAANSAGFLPKPGQVQASDGKVVAVGPLDFTFKHRAWWVTKIDLRRAPQPDP